jgi:hypothetical protein
LATMSYDLIILRVHTGLGNAQAPIGLFTNELYDPNRYVLEQASLTLGAAQADPSGPVVFAVTPKFIRETMQGRFANTIVILGGCYGLKGGDLAQAFIGKGARVIVGWTGLVDLDHTDKALNVFLQSFVRQNMTIQESVETTMRTVGADPTFHSYLTYYPVDQGSVSLKSGTAVIGFSTIGSIEPSRLESSQVSMVQWTRQADLKTGGCTEGNGRLEDLIESAVFYKVDNSINAPILCWAD